MSLYRRTISKIEDGMSSQVLAIPTGLPKYDELAYGTRQATYYLYGGETGTGKTTFAREKHMYVPYEFYKQVNDDSKLDIQFVDFNLEMPAEVNLATAMSRKMYMEYGRILPVAKMMGWDRSAGILSEDNLRILHSYADYYEEFERKLIIVQEDVTAIKFHDVLFEICKRHGTFSREGRWIWECGTFTPRNPALFLIAFIDTINLGDTDPENKTVKSMIDKISRMLVWFRNICGVTGIVLQQFNADISETQRRKHGISTPQLRDFEDSKRTTKDADVVWGLFEPQKHMPPDDKKFRGYDLSILQGWYRSIHLLKHRNGVSNRWISLKFNGLSGIFTELPPADLMTEEQYRLATTI